MPMVGKKEYSYSAKGMAMAKADAKKSGKKMVMKKTAKKKTAKKKTAKKSAKRRGLFGGM
jgi:hypothetical protein